jgi:amino acid transporter
MTQPVFETTATALREKSKLQRHFRRFDMLFYLICTVVTIDTIGAVASNVYGGHVASDGSATLTGAGLILGRVAAIVFIFALASAGTTWIMGSDRTEAVAAVDGGGPRVLGRFSAGSAPRSR